MSRGSIQLRHRKGCAGKGKTPRGCKCTPTVYAVINGQWAKVGYLGAGWRARDLDPFEARLVDMRNRHAAGQQWQPRKMLKLSEYAETWFADLYAAAEVGRISKLTYNTYEGVWHNPWRPRSAVWRLRPSTRRPCDGSSTAKARRASPMSP